MEKHNKLRKKRRAFNNFYHLTSTFAEDSDQNDFSFGHLGSLDYYEIKEFNNKRKESEENSDKEEEEDELNEEIDILEREKEYFNRVYNKYRDQFIDNESDT
ncbi:hypothetical protein ABK040_001528 [Willaertia magna]